MNNFMIGCNYWASHAGIEMWKNWSAKTIRGDLKALSQCGVEYLRVFPLWRDFQPVKSQYSWANKLRGYVMGEDERDLENNPDAIDPVMIERFRTFAKIADEFNMKLIVSVVTGWMSGRMFVPPALEGKNLLTDYEVLMWTGKFIRGFVTRTKDIENIVMWDLGNECNCMQVVNTRQEAYTWLMFCRNAIYSADSSRKIASGMHSLEISGVWRLDDHGEICDVLTTHPYPLPGSKCEDEPVNRMKPTIIPTIQSEWYSALSRKPCMIQEQGSFATSRGNEQIEADFLRVNMISAWANNLTGYLWWCAHEQLNLNTAPYTWNTGERELGILNPDREPKIAGKEMRRMGDVIRKLPDIENKCIDAVCIPCYSDKFGAAAGCAVLAKQAGFNVSFADNEKELPVSQCYIVPSIMGETYMSKKTHDTLIKRVENDGATLVVTFNGGQYNEFEKVFGLKSNGYVKCTSLKTANFDFGKIHYTTQKEILCESIGAEVLARNDEGNVVMAKNKLGKGVVYFLGFGIEEYALAQVDGFDTDVSEPFYKVYSIFGDKFKEKYFVTSENPHIGITQSKCRCESGYVVTIINYSDKPVNPMLSFDNRKNYDFLYGNKESVPACDAVIIKVTED